MRQWLSFREYFRRGNARPRCRGRPGDTARHGHIRRDRPRTAVGCPLLGLAQTTLNKFLMGAGICDNIFPGVAPDRCRFT